jgi:hypothetical protein
MIRRRDFITILGSTATWPIAARAQQPERMRRIGVLMGVTDSEQQAALAVFQKVLRAAGRRSAWLDRRCRQPKTCTGADSCTAANEARSCTACIIQSPRRRGRAASAAAKARPCLATSAASRAADGTINCRGNPLNPSMRPGRGRAAR